MSVQWLSSSEWVRDFKPPEYLIDGVIQRGYCYSFTAPTGHGKTAVALYLSACVTLGTGFLGKVMSKGRVGYFAAENPTDVQSRWIAMSEEMGFNLNEIDVHFIGETVNLSESFHEIKSASEKVGGFDLIVVDTSQAFFFGEDENANAEMVEHAKAMRRLTTLPGKPCVIILTHPVKNATRDNLAPRGGGGLVAEVDGNLTAWNDDGLVTLHHSVKLRGPGFAPIHFELRSVTCEKLMDGHGRPMQSVVARPMTEKGYHTGLAEAVDDQDKVLISLDRAQWAIPAYQICEEWDWKAPNGDWNTSKVYRLYRALEKTRLVKRTRAGKWALTKAGKKEIEGKLKEGSTADQF